MATYKELQAQLEALRGQADQARQAEQAAVLDQIRALIVEYQLLPSDLGFAVPGKRRATAPAAAKYRDPVSGLTWSGRGRAPKWLEGSDRARFAI